MSSLKWTCSSLTCFYEDIYYTGDSAILACQCREQWEEGRPSTLSLFVQLKVVIPATYLLVLRLPRNLHGTMSNHVAAKEHIVVVEFMRRKLAFVAWLYIKHQPCKHCRWFSCHEICLIMFRTRKETSLCFSGLAPWKKNFLALRHTMQEEIFQKFFPLKLWCWCS